MPEPIDWSRYQQCPVCFAELGKPCWSLLGYYDGEVVSVEAAEPHSTRKLRAEAARTGGDRG